MKGVETEEERRLWEELSSAYMTEESEDEDGNFVQHKLPWESDS